MIKDKKQIQNLVAKEVCYYLHTRKAGLDSHEVAERLKEVGLNSIEVRDRHKTLKSFMRQFTNFFTILLNISAGICFFAHSIAPEENINILGFALLGVSLLNAFFSFIQEYKAEKAMEALRKFLPQKVKVKRENLITEILADQLVPGDILLLAEGDRIAADARIISSNNLLVNNAPLTGESRPINLVPEKSNLRLEESRNIAFAGSSILRGSAQSVVFATGLRTEFGKLARLSQAIKREPSPLEKETSHMVKVLTVIATLMGSTFFFYGVFTGKPLWINLVFMMGIIVANVPEGLLPTFTLSLAMGSLRMAKKNVLVKSLNAVEAMGAVHVICTDKTGTLTRNTLSITKMIDYKGNNLNSHGEKSILLRARCASEVLQTESGSSGDPLDVEVHNKFMQITKSFEKYNGLFKSQRYFPFDTSLRRSGSINKLNNRSEYIVKGAWEVISPFLSHFSIDGSAENKIECSQKDLMITQKTVKTMASRGLRVLGVATKVINDIDIKQKRESLERDLTFIGFLIIEDPIREEVPKAVLKCAQAGIDVILITGDHPDTALSVAKTCNIVSDQKQYLTGSELENLTQSQLIGKIESGVRVFARSTPEQKMKIVSALKAMEKVTAMTGDGVNDAPALKAADVGVAMGKSGTDVARESAQIILLDDNFASIVSGIEEGRTVFANIRKFTNYVLVSNGPEILPYLIYILFPVPLALNVIQILSIDLGTDIIPSMGLGQEPPDPEEMKRPPRKIKNNLMDPKLILHSYLFLGLLEGAWSLSLFFYILISGGWSYGERLSEDVPLYRSAMGIALATILLMQIGNLIGRRFSTRSGLDLGLFKNRLIFAGIIIQIVFSWAVLYFPPVQNILHTGPVDISIYFLSWAGIPLIFGSDYLRKQLVKRYRLWKKVA